MTDELATNMASSRRLYEEVFGSGNLEVADEILAADAVSHGPGAPPVTGTEQIKRQASLLRSAFSDFKVTLNDQFGSGDRVCSRWTGAGMFTGALTMPGVSVPPTGEAISFDEIRIDRYQNGWVVESWFIPDRLTLWQKWGLLRSP